MPTTFSGVPTKPMPASMTNAMKKGYPPRVAQAMGAKPRSTVKVK